jgi:hypothetical protein
MEDPEQVWNLESSTGNCVPLATGDPAAACEETDTAAGAELEGTNADSTPPLYAGRQPQCAYLWMF